MTNHIPITPDLTKHFIAKKNGNIESHAKIKLFCKHRSEVKKKKKKIHNIFRTYEKFV